MTYLAPRQGLFAIIVTLSFILHTLLLVASNHQQLEQINQQTGERIVEQLISESTLALSSQDKVSLSVLAKRYTSEFDIAFLVIKDGDNSVLVSLGDNPLSQGEKIVGVATLEDALLGEITLGLEPISIGKIFASSWLFILFTFLIHVFIWLLYGYVSRPTKEQLATLSQEVRAHLLEEQPRVMRPRRGERITTEKNADLTSKPSMSEMLQANMNSGQAVHNQSINDAVYDQDLHQQPIDNKDAKTPKETQQQAVAKTLVADREMAKVIVQIQFVDKDNLLSTLAPEKSQPYFALCTQLLEQTIADLQKLPLLHGVIFAKVTGFGAPMMTDNDNNNPNSTTKPSPTGASIEIIANNEHAKIALAAVMLAKLYVMLNRIVYTKHRELQRFALNVKVGLSDEALTQPMQQLMSYHAEADDILVLLPKAGMAQLNTHIQLKSIKRPTTVYERECAFVIGTNDAMMYRLVQARNNVLLSGRQDIR